MHYAGKLIEWAMNRQTRAREAPVPPDLRGQGLSLLREMQKGQVQSVVGGLSEPAQAWCRFAYLVSGHPECRYRLVCYALDNMAANGGPYSLPFNQVDPGLDVIGRLIENARAASRGQVPRWTKTALAGIVGVTPYQFRPAAYWGRRCARWITRPGMA